VAAEEKPQTIVHGVREFSSTYLNLKISMEWKCKSTGLDCLYFSQIS